MGKKYSAEDSTDKLRWGWITVAGDNEFLLEIEILLVREINFSRGNIYRLTRGCEP